MKRVDPNILPNIKGAYLVGGSIRDILLDRTPVDYDIAVLDNPDRFAKKMAALTHGKVVRIGKPGKMITRVVADEKNFDITHVSTDIESDLRQRDFTINALAYSLSSGRLIDCTGGLRDLADKKIRMVSGEVFKNDPVRLFRAYRIGAALGFEIEQHTCSAIKKNAALIQNSPGERIRAELFKTLLVQNSQLYISQMVGTGLLFAVFPELERLKGCLQNKYHSFDVFCHTMYAFSHLELLIKDINILLPKIRQYIGAYIDNNRYILLKLAILLHDIGKPDVKTIDEQGNIHFYGHGREGADMAKKISDRLKFSSREKQFLDFVVRNHLRPLFLYSSYRKKKLTKKSISRFFITCGEFTPYVLIHSIADFQGKKNTENKDYKEFAESIILEFFEKYKPKRSKPPLITGNDLISEFGLTPSPLFKEILNFIQEAELSNEISDRGTAFKLIENFLKQRN